MIFEKTFVRVFIGILIGIVGTIAGFYLWLQHRCPEQKAASQSIPEQQPDNIFQQRTKRAVAKG